MSIPTSMSSAGFQPARRSGFRVVWAPADPSAWSEVQCSSSTAFPSSGTLTQKFAPSASNLSFATYEMPYSTMTYFVRARAFKTGYSTSPWTTIAYEKPYYLVDQMPYPALWAQTRSSLFSLQGSMLPAPNDLLVGNNLNYNSGGAVSPHMWLSWNWINATLYRPDGSTIFVGGSGGIPSISTSLSAVAGGALGARTRFVRVVLVKDHMFYYGTTNNELSLAVGANNLLRVASPTLQRGFDGWAVLVGATSNTEFTQPSPLTPLPFGTAWTEPAGGAGVSGAITAVELAAGSTYFFYPAWDTRLPNLTGVGLLRMACARAGGPSTSTDAPSAQLQNSDTLFGLSLGAVTGATPAAGMTGSGSSGTTTNVSTAKYL